MVIVGIYSHGVYFISALSLQPGLSPWGLWLKTKQKLVRCRFRFIYPPPQFRLFIAIHSLLGGVVLQFTELIYPVLPRALD